MIYVPLVSRLKKHGQFARVVASRLQYLGMQDAPRKRRIDERGPWAGTIYSTKDQQISKTVSQAKWDKAKGYVALLKEMGQAKEGADYKILEKIRGFFCHLAMTFQILFPYLKGLHLTLSSHLKNRNEEGWKIKELEWLGLLHTQVAEGKLSEEDLENLLREEDPKPPKLIVPVPRYFRCLEALEKFFEPDEPPLAVERRENYLLLLYGFVDASKAGMGSIFASEKGNHLRMGMWGPDTEEDSSNWREFENLVLNVEEEAKKGNLKGALVVLATDNKVTESCLYKGNAKSEKLFDLIVRLRTLEMREGAQIIVTHVAGTRMQKQGTDGLSRGADNIGAAAGKNMFNFCPWAKSPLEQNSQLEGWLRSFIGKDMEILQPCDWFRRAHDWDGGYWDDQGFWRQKIRFGHYVWNIPAGAADAAFEQLRRARIKRRESYHFIVIPALCTPLWLKQMHKECDFITMIPPEQSFWSSNECESLYLGICFP